MSTAQMSTGGGEAAPRGQSADAKPVDWFARFLAAVGILVALINFGFTIYKMRRDRRLSIEDDFWFRKVLTPTTIEPLLDTLVELLGELPTIDSQDDEKQSFSIAVTRKFQGLYSSVQALSLIYKDLPICVTDALRECEDVLTEYAASLSNEGGTAPDSSQDVRSSAWEKMNKALTLILDKHRNQR